MDADLRHLVVSRDPRALCCEAASHWVLCEKPFGQACLLFEFIEAERAKPMDITAHSRYENGLGRPYGLTRLVYQREIGHTSSKPFTASSARHNIEHEVPREVVHRDSKRRHFNPIPGKGIMYGIWNIPMLHWNSEKYPRNKGRMGARLKARQTQPCLVREYAPLAISGR